MMTMTMMVVRSSSGMDNLPEASDYSINATIETRPIFPTTKPVVAISLILILQLA